MRAIPTIAAALVFFAVSAFAGPGCNRKGTRSDSNLNDPISRTPRNAAAPSTGPGSSDGGPGTSPSVPRRFVSKHPVVRIRTDKGNIWIELYPKRAPQTVANFLKYVAKRFYDGTVFHRVIKGFLLQGGGYTPELKAKPVGSPVPSEAKGGLLNLRGTVALARLDRDPHSGAAQFFINLKDNMQLNHRGRRPLERGFAVFGRVIAGMEVADKLGSVRTCRKGPFSRDVPCKPLVIRSIKRIQ